MRAQLGSCGVFSIPYTVTVPCREGEVLEGALNFVAYPNPFTTNTTLVFESDREQACSVKIYDATGKLIETLMDQIMVQAGETRIDYSTSQLSAGLYFAEIITETGSKRIRLMSAE